MAPEAGVLRGRSKARPRLQPGRRCRSPLWRTSVGAMGVRRQVTGVAVSTGPLEPAVVVSRLSISPSPEQADGSEERHHQGPSSLEDPVVGVPRGLNSSSSRSRTWFRSSTPSRSRRSAGEGASASPMMSSTSAASSWAGDAVVPVAAARARAGRGGGPGERQAWARPSQHPASFGVASSGLSNSSRAAASPRCGSAAANRGRAAAARRPAKAQLSPTGSARPTTPLTTAAFSGW